MPQDIKLARAPRETTRAEMGSSDLAETSGHLCALLGLCEDETGVAVGTYNEGNNVIHIKIITGISIRCLL